MGLCHGRGHELALCDPRRSSGSSGWKQQKDSVRENVLVLRADHSGMGHFGR